MLETRVDYPAATLADFYDPDLMPPSGASHAGTRERYEVTGPYQPQKAVSSHDRIGTHRASTHISKVSSYPAPVDLVRCV